MRTQRKTQGLLRDGLVIMGVRTSMRFTHHKWGAGLTIVFVVKNTKGRAWGVDFVVPLDADDTEAALVRISTTGLTPAALSTMIAAAINTSSLYR